MKFCILLSITCLTWGISAYENPPPPGTVLLATFDGAKETTRDWTVTNDPVMGGVSHSTFQVDKTTATMTWKGETKIVPSLKAPGFCNLETKGIDKFQSAKGKSHLMMSVRTSTPEYLGFKVSFAARTLNPQFKSFKTNFNLTTAGEYEVLALPWDAFSKDWSPFTGNCDTKDPTGKQHKCCNAQNPEVCPTSADLEDFEALGIWTEGFAGDFTLDIEWIGAGSPASIRDPPPAGTILLATFDGEKKTTHNWRVTNDPVMGGRSHSKFNIDATSKTLKWAGVTEIVPSLKAPGFCNLETPGFEIGKYSDVSRTSHLMLRVRTDTPEYLGYKFSFAARTLQPQFKSFKSNFNVTEAAGDWQIVSIPWSSFSNDWSPYTGNCDTKDPTGTQHKCCSSEHPEVCPTKADLDGIQSLGVWTEGVAGNFTLEIDWVGAGDGTVLQGPGDHDNFCTAPIQQNLRYNVSGRLAADYLPFGALPKESLAQGVCCDEDYRPYAEPQFFYNRSDVNFLSYLTEGKVVTFYDSVCGIPLFTAPKGRSLQDFIDETNEHGWPSFRAEEAVPGNTKIQPDNEVISACGTHLGSNLADGKGVRYCLDLSCISGNPKKN